MALSSRNPINDGLVEALRTGAAIALGRLGGLQYQKQKIEAGVWDSDWQFQILGGFAVGGVPPIEIHDVKIFLHDNAAYKTPLMRRGGGPKAKFGCPAIEQETYRLMWHHGDFSPDDDEWSSQACLLRALQEFCQKVFGIEPADSTLKQKNRVPQWIGKWRSEKAAVKTETEIKSTWSEWLEIEFLTIPTD